MLSNVRPQTPLFPRVRSCRLPELWQIMALVSLLLRKLVYSLMARQFLRTRLRELWRPRGARQKLGPMLGPRPKVRTSFSFVRTAGAWCQSLLRAIIALHRHHLR